MACDSVLFISLDSCRYDTFAAASAAGLRMPFSSMLLAVLLCAAAGPAVTVLAGVGVVIGLILGLALLPAAAVQEEQESRDAGPSTPAGRAV